MGHLQQICDAHRYATAAGGADRREHEGKALQIVRCRARLGRRTSRIQRANVCNAPLRSWYGIAGNFAGSGHVRPVQRKTIQLLPLRERAAEGEFDRAARAVQAPVAPVGGAGPCVSQLPR